jgi:sulfur transfer protein SufE
MSDALNRINSTINDFTTQSQFDSWLMELGKKKIPFNIRQKENFIRGCQVDVWITTHSDGTLLFDSDSAHIRGLCSVLSQVLCETATVQYSAFDSVTKHIPVIRKRGFQKLLNKAQSLLTQQHNDAII